MKCIPPTGSFPKWCLTVGAGLSRVVGAPSAIFSDALAWSWIGSKAARTQTGALIYDARIANDNLVCYATLLAPQYLLLNCMLGSINTAPGRKIILLHRDQEVFGSSKQPRRKSSVLLRCYIKLLKSVKVILLRCAYGSSKIQRQQSRAPDTLEERDAAVSLS